MQAGLSSAHVVFSGLPRSASRGTERRDTGYCRKSAHNHERLLPESAKLSSVFRGFSSFARVLSSSVTYSHALHRPTLVSCTHLRTYSAMRRTLQVTRLDALPRSTTLMYRTLAFRFESAPP